MPFAAWISSLVDGGWPSSSARADRMEPASSCCDWLNRSTFSRGFGSSFSLLPPLALRRALRGPLGELLHDPRVRLSATRWPHPSSPLSSTIAAPQCTSGLSFLASEFKHMRQDRSLGKKSFFFFVFLMMPYSQ